MDALKQGLIGDRWPAPHFIKQMTLYLLLRLETSVLKASYQKMGMGCLARLKEREQIGSPISHMDGQRFCGIAARR